MPPSPALVRVDRFELPGLEHVAEIVLDRPEAMNAVSTEMARAIAAATEQVARDDTVRCVVLTSSHDRAFCVGADLKERNAFTDAELMEQRPVARAAYGGVLALPVPAIAAVDGFALGGGFELALSCDLVVAGEGALVGLPEVSVGVIPGGGGTQLLVRRVGWSRAARTDLHGRPARRRGRARARRGRRGGAGRHGPGPRARARRRDRRALARRAAQRQAGDAARRRRRPGDRSGGRGRLLAGDGLLG